MPAVDANFCMGNISELADKAVLEACLAFATATYPSGTAFPVWGTAAQYILIARAAAASPTATVVPPVVVATQSVVAPTQGISTAAPANSCPIAKWIASGSNITVLFEAGKTYHVNMSENGAPAGVEANSLFTVTTTFEMTFDGSVWEYPGLVTDGQCQLCSETAGDHWVENIPELNGLVEYHTPPCAGQPTVTPGDLFIKSVKVK
jgi:hypothetical protein